jgi:UPF0716 protein FxsA
MRAVLVFVFIVVPLVELAIIIQVGEVLGVGPTILLLLAVSLAGAWLVRREGTRAWWRFRDAVSRGRVPTDEVLEGALVLFGGALLLTPGFATDAVGLSLMVPPVRGLVATTLKRRLGARFTVTSFGTGRPPSGRPPARPPRDDVVDVEVINIERSSSDGDQAARNGDIHKRDSGSA